MAEEERRPRFSSVVVPKCDGFSGRLMNNAFGELLAFQRALKDLVASVDGTYAKQYEEFSVGLEGSFGNKHVTPRTLTSRLLGSMVCVEGIITKCEWIRLPGRLLLLRHNEL